MCCWRLSPRGDIDVGWDRVQRSDLQAKRCEQKLAAHAILLEAALVAGVILAAADPQSDRSHPALHQHPLRLAILVSAAGARPLAASVDGPPRLAHEPAADAPLHLGA